MKCHLCNGDKFSTIEESPVHLVICQRCNLIFIENTHPADFYKELYKKRYGFIAPAHADARHADKKNLSSAKWILGNIKNEAPQALARGFLKRNTERPLFWPRMYKNGVLRLLEVGYSSGSLLKLLENELGGEVYGIEPNEEAVRYARLGNKLDHIENCFIEETKYPSRFFDAIILVQTFEHFLNPVESLTKIRDLLKDDGELFIEVPDAFSIVGVYRWGLEPSHYHLYIYTADTLTSLLNKCGFEVVRLEKTFLNIRIIAWKGTGADVFRPLRRTSYKNFLFVNRINKQALKAILKARNIILRLKCSLQRS